MAMNTEPDGVAIEDAVYDSLSICCCVEQRAMDFLWLLILCKIVFNSFTQTKIGVSVGAQGNVVVMP